MELVVLALAIFLDLIFAEPPLLVHPVFWFGKIIELFDGLRRGNVLDLIFVTFAVLAVILFALLLCKISKLLPFSVIWQAYLLFSAISIRSMVQHAEACINNGISRINVQKIVSRDTSRLSESQLCSAVIESTAENFVDGVLAPLLYFSIFGLPGALIYRAVNVSDAMIGYKTEKYFYFGKLAARLDDILNYIPSRLSLLFFEVLKGGSVKFGFENNVKLNGHSIAAMAYVLGVKLEKPGHYSIGMREAGIEDVKAAIITYKKLCFMAVVFSFALTTFRILLLT